MDAVTTATYNCTDPLQRAEGLAHAQRAIAQKQCVVIPTDTVYGIAADAFSAQAVATLLAAKGRGRSMPPPVLIPRLQTMDGLATEVPAGGRALAEKFWPGPLTLILHAQPSLTWDLGETKGTVALRIPDDELAQALLTITGPLAVSSANRTGQAAAQTASEAREQLAESVEVYLEEGFRPVEGTAESGGLPSTIVDCTGERLRVVRQGALSLDAIREIVPDVLGLGEEPETLTEPEAAQDPLTLAKPEEQSEPEVPARVEPAQAEAEAAQDEPAQDEPAPSDPVVPAEPVVPTEPENVKGQPRD
ncbi:L-threonylcarbamoyladenylate synthase [Sinomonas sp. ASV486]|nr:L-threonylcarbamoyladenylate synthase [Sinomonas sp. ASV486]MDQ4490545.1 L-threonylcarbamoyladenylate synthase [Sinomonas sp. ASV486]